MKGANGINESGTKNKKKKDGIKSTLDSPFNFKWPALDYGLYSNVVSCLNESFSKYIGTIKCEAEKNESEADVPATKVKNRVKRWLARAEPPCIVFGYNAVMRGLEKGDIKSVFVKAEATPGYLTKTFIPICNLKDIPLVPIKNLSQIFENHISTKSSLAVGLTCFACKENAPFFDLYQKSCKAVGLSKKLSCVSAHKATTASPLEEMQKSKPKMVDVSSFHLKRENKSYRVFKPSNKNDDLGSGFIKIDSLVADQFASRRRNPKCEDKTINETDSDAAFFIDVGGESMTKDTETETVDYHQKSHQKSTARFFSAIDNSSETNCSNKRELNYIPAKIKRIKGNPNRH